MMFSIFCKEDRSAFSHP